MLAATSALITLTGCVATTSGIAKRGATPVAVATTTATTTVAPAPSPSPAPALSFTDCRNNFDVGQFIGSDRLGHLSIDCGKLRVPLDYDNPSLGMISIQAIRLHWDQQPQRVGSLVINPGGPGESGIPITLSLAGQMDLSMLKHFDLVGFDPRGVGASSPLNCVTNAEKDALNNSEPNMLTQAGQQQAKAESANVAKECSDKYGTSLLYYNTVETAKDMDMLRAALQDSQLTYLGFSYGTTLGAEYAHLFPTNVRAAVLDGAVDPTVDSTTFLADQVQAFEAAFDQFAADCVKRADCKKLGNPRSVVYSLVQRSTATPIKSRKAGEKRTAGPGIVLLGVLSALYSQDTWPDLGAALLQAQAGDSQGLFTLADNYNERSANGTYTNVFDANTAISCNDSPPGPDDATIAARAAAWAKAYPMFGLWASSSLYSCQAWQPNRTVLPQPSAPGSKPILVIGTTHDPATPYAGAQRLAAALGSAALLTWQGQGHTAYLEGSKCVDTAVNSYLLTATPPATGTVCQT